MSNLPDTRSRYAWLYDILFLLVLALAAYLRLAGVDWGEFQHQHPDENFFTSVVENLRAHECVDPAVPIEACPPEQQRWISILDYFSSERSTLSPYNRGFTFYVYGNLPLTLIRIAAEATDQENLRSFGRQFSAFADLFSILFLYLIVARLYGRRVGLLAALFSALTVMQIQQSHFFTTDLFVNAFAFLAIWFAVAILEHREQRGAAGDSPAQTPQSDSQLQTLDPQPETPRPLETHGSGRATASASSLQSIVTNHFFLFSVGFGLALGMAMASKINIAPLAIMLPAAFILRHLVLNKAGQHSLLVGSGPLKTDYWTLVIICLVAGGLATLISFRVFQPYAFQGIGLNPQWVANIREQRVQATGGADLPWELQWARRTHLYSFTNLTLWGFGLPLGLLAWAGFLYMGWRILQGEWRHALLWGWAAFYFTWQSLQFNPTMRYQLPVYPLLALMAAWFVFEAPRFSKLRIAHYALRAAGALVVILTAIWAFAFLSIYTRDEPRIAASRWIYQNVPGPINLRIQETGDSTYNQPVPFPTGTFVQPGQPYQTAFTAQKDGLLQEISLAHVAAVPGGEPAQLYLTVWQDSKDSQPLASAYSTPPSVEISNDTSQVVNFDQPPVLTADQTYYVKLELSVPDALVQVCGAMQVMIQAGDQVTEQTVDVSAPCTVDADEPYTITFVPQVSGTLNMIALENVANVDPRIFTDPQVLRLSVLDDSNHSLASASITGIFAPNSDPRGDALLLELDQPVRLTEGARYFLRMEVSEGVLTVSSATVANETDYDYGLPFRVDGYDAFGGIYNGLNLQIYWDDNPEKLESLVRMLDHTDYIFIPTNHQYAQITRLPERYPLTTLYYRELIGCPPEKDIIWCYNVARPGDFDGRLGFDLVTVFETYPTLGPIVINDQSAEEAFTFYDHPKVSIFRKNPDFDAAQVRSVLGEVDLSKVVRLTARQFNDFSDLLLPADRLAQQRAGGTWSELFNYDWVYNRYPILGLAIWYLFIFILGLAVYPLVRLAMPGLQDKGYPLSRAFGLVLFGYLAWVAGSLAIPYTRATIAVVFGLIVLAGLALAYYQRAELREEWRSKRTYFLMIEGLFLAFFLIDLLIRIGNPDLWHPAKGGERPMDFSYFNAILKSTSFPPYDPWFAGGYINYYYYGFVLVATPVKLLGIVPTIAYNFLLPTLFALVGVCAFSLGWNLLAKDETVQTDDESPALRLPSSALIAGLSASFLTMLLGNLGTIQLLYQKMQELGAAGAFSWEPTISIFQRWQWAFQGFILTLKGNSLPIGLGEWYWNPSRVVPPLGGNEITEFPLFTFLYSDLHAHMIAMPLALLSLSWAFAVVAGRARWRNPLSAGLGLAVGGLVIGALYPANLSDTYTYLLVGLFALGYAVWRYAEVGKQAGVQADLRKLLVVAGGALALLLLSVWLYQPYRAWYSQAYSAVDPWKGPFTPIGSYLVHWAVFLFILVSWMAWETREWMAQTPVSALRKLKPYQLLIEGFLVMLVLALLVLAYQKIRVGWIALPIAAWAGVLLLRPSLPDAKRFVLFLIGTALLITLVVEIVVVRGDIGRQNTIFKFYLQAWFMLAVSAGAGFAWTLPAFFKWLPGWRLFWQTAMILLISGAALFSVSGTAGKVRDRWIVEAPRTLDSMTFMKYAQYDDFGQRLDLSEDYHAIRWLQDNVKGSPVIVEANCPEYRWCTRFTIYTGLPGVVGWNWHQRQQRAFMPHWVTDRVDAITNFYNSVDLDFSLNFLESYDVKYIMVGQLERAAYTPEGIAKFEQYDGAHWNAVYRDANTVIYEVTP
ncbi:MAG TPA: DUF2298 domain-containing protein [Anaerolineales bacterium]|nr:DUF2298 domain-containing protein [Anaerolineales bacterium]